MSTQKTMDHADTCGATDENKPLWRITTMAQVKRVYEVYADTEDDACELLNAHGADVLVYEEEINEDIDDVSALSKALNTPVSGGNDGE